MIDLGRTGFRDAHAQRLGSDLDVESAARRRPEHLGVAQALDRLKIVEDHCSGHHRPSQRTTADLVDTGHQPRRRPAQRKLLRLGR